MHVAVDAGFDQIAAGSNTSGKPSVPFDLIQFTKDMPEHGYVYIYLSNEDDQESDVYFDDFKVTLNQHPVIQTDDYYPLHDPLERGACPAK